MRKRILIMGPLWLAAFFCEAADEPPLMRPEDRMLLDRQSEELANAASVATREIGRSVVWVNVGKRQNALGTVVGDGSQVLTKWSQIAGQRGILSCVTATGRTLRATVAGVYEEDDVALLALDGEKLPPTRWSAARPPDPGRFMVAALPDGTAAAVGVVSVSERSLREADHAFLGIESGFDYDGPGVLVGRVIKGSGAAKAGIRRGDVVMRVGDRRVDGLFELRAALNGSKPGESVTLGIDRNDAEVEAEVLLGGRPEFQQIPAERLRAMEQMAGDQGTSLVGDEFPQVIQTDMKVWPQHCGGPAVDLDGRVVGLVIARATRTRSFVIPNARVMELLKGEAVEPALAKVGSGAGDVVPRARPIPEPGRRFQPKGLQRRRERVNELRQFMDRFLREMGSLDGR